MLPHGKAGAADCEQDGTTELDLASTYMGNTSTFPLFRNGYDAAKLMDEFPAYREKVWPYAMEAVLQPGDMLIMPPGWWHAMRGEGDGPSWSVSMWY